MTTRTIRRYSPRILVSWPDRLAAKDASFAFRVAHKLTQTEAAKRFGLTPKLVSNIECTYARTPGWAIRAVLAIAAAPAAPRRPAPALELEDDQTPL